MFISMNMLIKYKNNNTLLLFNDNYLLLFDITQLKIIGKLKNFCNKIYTITTIQINNNELLIGQKRYIYLLNLNSFQIKSKVEYEDIILYISQLRDKSIIISSTKCAKRMSPKTFEIMSFFNDSTIRFYSYLNPHKYNYIIKFIQISDTNIVLILNDGQCLLKQLTF